MLKEKHLMNVYNYHDELYGIQTMEPKDKEELEKDCMKEVEETIGKGWFFNGVAICNYPYGVKMDNGNYAFYAKVSPALHMHIVSVPIEGHKQYAAIEVIKPVKKKYFE